MVHLVEPAPHERKSVRGAVYPVADELERDEPDERSADDSELRPVNQTVPSQELHWQEQRRQDPDRHDEGEEPETDEPPASDDRELARRPDGLRAEEQEISDGSEQAQDVFGFHGGCPFDRGVGGGRGPRSKGVTSHGTS